MEEEELEDEEDGEVLIQLGEPLEEAVAGRPVEQLVVDAGLRPPALCYYALLQLNQLVRHAFSTRQHRNYIEFKHPLCSATAFLYTPSQSPSPFYQAL